MNDMDEKEEDKSKDSFQKHLIFYKKLNAKILEIQKEIDVSNDPTILKHLNERIEALTLDKARIKKLFPQAKENVWSDPE